MKLVPVPNPFYGQTARVPVKFSRLRERPGWTHRQTQTSTSLATSRHWPVAHDARAMKKNIFGFAGLFSIAHLGLGVFDRARGGSRFFERGAYPPGERRRHGKKQKEVIIYPAAGPRLRPEWSNKMSYAYRVYTIGYTAPGSRGPDVTFSCSPLTGPCPWFKFPPGNLKTFPNSLPRFNFPSPGTWKRFDVPSPGTFSDPSRLHVNWIGYVKLFSPCEPFQMISPYRPQPCTHPQTLEPF